MVSRQIGMEAVILIRHPAAFVSSIKKLNWTHPFSHFIEQPSLMASVLAPFAADIKEYARGGKGSLDQAILLWRLIHYVIAKYRETHKDWIFVRHEDVSRDPAPVFASLYRRLNLDFSDDAAAKILEYSIATNPADPQAQVGSEATLRRNSPMNVWNWKNNARRN